MKALKGGIAKQANREDGCTGAFWEGRYTSVPLLDQAALVACMAYVDLNPVRAKVVDRHERSPHTGVRQRIVARQRHRRAQRAQTKATVESAVAFAPAAHAEAGLRVVPMAGCVVTDPGNGARSGLTPDECPSLVDATGRVLRLGKRGAIPAELAPILARLDLDVERWLAAMTGWRSLIGRAVGGFAVRLARAMVLVCGGSAIAVRCFMARRAGTPPESMVVGLASRWSSPPTVAVPVGDPSIAATQAATVTQSRAWPGSLPMRC